MHWSSGEERDTCTMAGHNAEVRDTVGIAEQQPSNVWSWGAEQKANAGLQRSRSIIYSSSSASSSSSSASSLTPLLVLRLVCLLPPLF